MSDPIQGAPSPAPSTTPAESQRAREAIAALKTDKSFGERLIAGDKAAEQQLDALQRRAVGIKPVTPPVDGAQQARAQIAALKTDPAFVEKINRGERAALDQLDDLEAKAAGFRGAADAPDQRVHVNRGHAGEGIPEHGREQGRPDLTEAQMTPKQLEQHRAMFEPAKPEDYEIRHPYELPPEEQAVDLNMRHWLSIAGTSKRDGDELAIALREAAPIVMDFSPEQHDAHQAQTRTKLERIFGAEMPARLADAQRLIKEINAQRPGLIAWLDDTGLGNQYDLVHQVIQAARRKYGK